MTILKLMEPFRRLHSIAPVKITGKTEAKYKSDLIARMLRRARDTDPYLQEYQDTMEQGDQAATIKDYPTAIANYKRALEEGCDFCAFYDVDKIILESGKFRGQYFDVAFGQIKFALEMKLASTCLNFGKHTHAREWIILAVDDINRSLYQSKRSGLATHARTHMIAAEASEGLELAERAVEEMKEEMLHNPGDSDLAVKQDRLKSRLEKVKEMLQDGFGDFALGLDG